VHVEWFELMARLGPSKNSCDLNDIAFIIEVYLMSGLVQNLPYLEGCDGERRTCTDSRGVAYYSGIP